MTLVKVTVGVEFEHCVDAQAGQERIIMAHDQHGAAEGVQGLREVSDAGDVKVVGRSSRNRSAPCNVTRPHR